MLTKAEQGGQASLLSLLRWINILPQRSKQDYYMTAHMLQGDCVSRFGGEMLNFYFNTF